MSLPDLSDLIGVPFLDLGRDPAKGLDCWGLVMEVFRRRGVTIPDYAVDTCFNTVAAFLRMSEATASGLWEAVPAPEVGDVVAMETNPDMPGCIDHYGVYIGQGRMIHTIRKHEVSAPKLRHAHMFGRVRGYYRWAG